MALVLSSLEVGHNENDGDLHQGYHLKKVKTIDEHIEEEEKLNHANKIRGIVQKLRIKGGMNEPNMWKVRDSIK